MSKWYVSQGKIAKKKKLKLPSTLTRNRKGGAILDHDKGKWGGGDKTECREVRMIHRNQGKVLSQEDGDTTLEVGTIRIVANTSLREREIIKRKTPTLRRKYSHHPGTIEFVASAKIKSTTSIWLPK